MISVVTVHSFAFGPRNKTEIFRAFVGESSQIEEEWRELLSTGGCCQEVTSIGIYNLVRNARAGDSCLDRLRSDLQFGKISFGARLFCVYTRAC